jgi:exodeoxyribonuclease V gamma subunit
LWRAVGDDVAPEQRDLGRVSVHNEFVAAVERGDAPARPLPRRIVLFGMSSMPYQNLQALAALATHTQVLLAVPNPCRYYWGDIIEGRELLRAAYKRQRQRGGRDLQAVPMEEMHAHCHPLLAAWGRQGRDFIRMLDEFDEAAAASARFNNLRLDLFGDAPGTTLLGQVQAAIRDLLPLADHPHAPPDALDRSIEFHVAHSVQREVEILHDQLLALLAQDDGPRPRDIVVMVPDIDVFTAAIHAVFGQHRRGDARFIPFEIGDVKDRSVNPLLVALEWLLRLPQQRCRQSEVRDLLDVPALAGRFGLGPDDLPLLGLWMEGAGVRWGLDQAHRDGLGLGSAGEQNAWIFGVRRMLLGYASGAGDGFHDIEPYAEVGGLDAALAGSLAQLIDALLRWRALLSGRLAPADWGRQARALLAAFFSADQEADRLTLARLDGALQGWLETCENAGFAEAVPLSVLREAWLGGLDEPTLSHQFVSGGVTFCTLMPMRAVPFRVVCLLGMNDGDFPRRAPRADFDLLAMPGMARPGDRSRRDDDRYLMLEALLAARDKLYVSWVGRNVRDNTEQPASVLVAQLRDYLAAGWDLDLAARTTEHALQPFSRRYFEAGGLLTYAGEWRAAHSADAAAGAGAPDDGRENPAGGGEVDRGSPLPPFELDPDHRLRLSSLTQFLRQPVRYFFRQRLGVVFGETALLGEDDEPFTLQGLERYGVEDSLLDDRGAPEPLDQVRATLAARARQLVRQGQLPIGLIGQQVERQLVDALEPVRAAWVALCLQYPDPAPKLAISLDFGGAKLDDWIDQLRSNGDETVWLMQMSSKVLDRKENLRGDKLLGVWLRQLAAAAQGRPVAGLLVARDAIVSLAPLDPDAARATLADLAPIWRDGLDRPLPVACKTALALLQEGDPRAAYDGATMASGEVDDLCLARLWPDYAALSSEEEWPDCAQALYGPLVAWLREAVKVDLIDAGAVADAGEAA